MSNALDTNRTVTVACKLPNGILIREFIEGTDLERGPAGDTRKIKIFRQVGRPFRIRGPAVPEGVHVELHGGYALTDGVPFALFEHWMAANAESLFVVNELVYGHEKRERVIAWAKEHALLKSGMEPLDVTMKSVAGRQMLADERVPRAGAELVVDGKLELR